MYIYMKKKQTLARGFCLTINNWTEKDYMDVIEFKTDYLIVGKETGESGTPHLQIYFYHRNKIDFNTIKKKFPRAHIEVAKGSPRDNFIYCSKDGDYKEVGERPQQGERRDLTMINEVLRKTGKIKDIIDVIQNTQQLKYAETVIKYIEPKRNFKPNTWWFVGPAGSGKSREAFKMFPDLWRKGACTNQWWDGYDSDENVLIDDIKEDSLAMYSQLLEVLDRYECRVQFKGGTRQLVAKNIIVSSAFHPYKLYKQFNQATELLRRIDEIKIFDNTI